MPAGGRDEQPVLIAANPDFSPAFCEAGRVLENPRRGFTGKAGGNAPGNRGILRPLPTPKGSHPFHVPSWFDPCRVGSDLHPVPGALPPASHVLPFQGNENQAATSAVGGKSGIGAKKEAEEKRLILRLLCLFCFFCFFCFL